MLKLTDCPKESLCPKLRLHDYRPVSSTTTDAVHRCAGCGGYGVWKMSLGKVIDQQGYVAAHFRDFLQPFYPTTDLFREFHGQEGIDRHDESLKPKPSKEGADDIVRDAKDELKNRSSVKVK